MTKLSDSIQYLKGVGEKRAKLYEKLGIYTIADILDFFPRDYQDYSNSVAICDAVVGEVCCIKGRVFKKQGEQRIRKGLSVFKVFVTDDTGDITITIFNSRFQYEKLELGKEYCFYGKLQGNFLRKEMNSPACLDPETEPMIKAIYHLTEGLSNKMISSAVRQALILWGDHLEDPLPVWMKQNEELCHLRYAYETIHFPNSMGEIEIARKRFIFEELLTLQLGLLLLRGRNCQKTAIRITDDNLQPFYDALPFVLTEGQQNAIKEGLDDLKKEVPMNRLIQGDVGSGKTMVASALAYCMANNGYQTAVMAPTEILAVQHYYTFRKILEPLGIRVALLTGSLSQKEKDKWKKEIAEGQAQVVVGTHALIQDRVSFSALGLVVTDEQHRFGVEQRAKLSQKGENPHKLVMSATPIPRTLALIIYGDLDISVITQMPKGRLPIKTYLINGEKRNRAFGFIKKHIDEGRQAYIVCPLIEDNSEVSSGEIYSVSQYAKSLRNSPLSNVRIGILHGKLKSSEKEEVMKRFQNHELDVLISTTVIEVGVDVPNAVIMMIENAERFGLSQLHQLRGRVGRGSIQSHCILVSDHQAEQTKERLKIMTKSSDGFYISEQDLKQRGPGDFFGERQHGLPELKIANMVTDMQVLKRTQEIARRILLEDSRLEKSENQGLNILVNKLFERSISND